LSVGWIGREATSRSGTRGISVNGAIGGDDTGFEAAGRPYTHTEID